MDKELLQKLKGFDQVWLRVSGEKKEPIKGKSVLMPRKKQKPKQRFDE